MNRPLGVTRLAQWQFFKAALLLLIAAVGLMYPAARPDSNVFIALLIYIAAHGANPRTFLIPLVALFPAAIGWGLLRLNKWARYTLLISSGLMLVRWIEYLLVSGWAFGEPIPHTLWAQRAVSILLLVDAAIFWYLLQSDVKNAFDEARP